MSAGLWDRVFHEMFPEQRWATPGDLALALDWRTNQTPALSLIDQELIRWNEIPESRLIITMSPQEGKSERCSKWLPAWMLECNPELKIVLASYADSLSRRNGRATRDVIMNHPEAFSYTVRDDLAAQHEWELEGHRGGVFAVGVGGGMTGRPADRVIIDDPVKDRQEAESEVYRDRVWDWWQDVVVARLAPTASVLVIMTRWHEDDLVGRLLERDKANWKVINIPAQCEDEETDLLGRKLGEFMISARGRTRAQWLKRKAEVGSRSWNALYQGRPSPTEGTIFLRQFATFYERVPWQIAAGGQHVMPGQGKMIMSWDCAFKDKKDSDFVVGSVWWRAGSQFLLLDQVRARMSFTATCEAMRALSKKWPQALSKYVEDKANGTAVIDHLRKELPGLIAVEPEGGKLARANAVSPLWEARNVILPSRAIAPWVDSYINEMASFPNGQHDDQVDSTTQALAQLLYKAKKPSKTQTLW